MPKLFQIGDMAKLFHISVSSLRYYESLGLLTPERVDPDTGYRYYSVRQFEVLNTIRYLRELDMPLPEISDFLKNRDIDRMEEKLCQQKAEIERKRLELQRIERRIDNNLRRIRDAQDSELDVIKYAAAPAMRIVWMDAALKISSSLDMEMPIRELEQSQAETALFLGKVGVGISAENLEAGSSTTECSSSSTMRTGSTAKPFFCRRRSAYRCASAAATRRQRSSTGGSWSISARTV